MTESRKTVWLLVARGVAAVVFGVLTLLRPQMTVLALAWVFGAYALADGAVLLGAAWRHRREGRPALACAVAGALGVVAGGMTALWPGLTALALVVMAGAWAIATGCLELWVATRMRHELRHAWWWRVSAAVSVAAGVLLWLWPDAGAMAIALVLGVYALIAGGIWLAAAWREYRMHTNHRSHSWTSRPSGARVAH
ncbi:HdeD family acid-resistance protein [Streptomyces sp. NPDC015171]|uniref:HdeD family acid-resistance protein n=1 Tax=Streptomyces sp. NPDC015171 TaxID=3364945 RepID=UPI0036F6C9B1